jgi:hypothetical protein
LHTNIIKYGNSNFNAVTMAGNRTISLGMGWFCALESSKSQG